MPVRPPPKITVLRASPVTSGCLAFTTEGQPLAAASDAGQRQSQWGALSDAPPSLTSPRFPSLPDRPPDADETRRAVDFVERAKELDFEHRIHDRGVAALTLSLTFLRRALRRFWIDTQRADAAAVPHPAPGTLALTFVGHATMMITTPAVRLLTDPLLENSLYGLRRVQAPAVDADDLADVNLVLISHARRDHLSRRSLAQLPSAAMVITPPGCAPLIADLGFRRVVELQPGQTFPFADLEITSVPVRHSGARRRGASGYVVRTPERVVYVAGDTGYFPGFAEIGKRFSPDVALLPIGGYQPAPFRREHLSPLDAAYAFQDLGASILIPTTFGSFELGYEPVDEPLSWLRALAAAGRLPGTLTVLEHGQTCLVR